MNLRLLLSLTLLLAVLNSNVLARCAGQGLSVFPCSGTSLPRNPVFVVELYGSSQDLAGGITTKYPVTLRGKGEKIPCRVIEILKGSFRSTQVLVTPIRALAGGQKYGLHIAIPASHSFPQQENPVYLAGQKASASAPAFSSIPEWIASNYTMFGCGPAITVQYAIRSNPAPFLYASLTAADGTTAAFVLPVDATGIFAFGHGMCSGSFELEPGKAYRATLQMMDLAGNKSREKISLDFTAPAPKHLAE